MTAEQFTYWLQGFLETADPKSIDEKQTKIIKDHLALVFTKVTPDYSKLFKDMHSKPLEIKEFDHINPDFTYRPGQVVYC